MSRHPNIIFAKTRTPYDSYSDYHRLIEVSEFETCFIDEIDISRDAQYIVSPINGEFRPHIDYQKNTHSKKRATIIWWNLERPDSGSDSHPFQETLDSLSGYVDVMWVSDKTYAAISSKLTFVPLGSDKKLKLDINPEIPIGSTYDFAHMSYAFGRRESLYHSLIQKRLIYAPNAWGETRDLILKSTKILLNVHQHQPPMPIGEPLRFALAATYKMALVSEHVADPYPMIDKTHFVHAPYERLGSLAESTIRNQELREQLGENLHQLFCVEQTFRNNVEQAVRSLI